MKNGKNNPDPMIDAVVRSSGGRINRAEAAAAANGDPSALLGSLSAREREQLLQIMNDRDALKNLLSGKQAQQILGQISGKNGNG